MKTLKIIFTNIAIWVLASYTIMCVIVTTNTFLKFALWKPPVLIMVVSGFAGYIIYTKIKSNGTAKRAE